MASRFDRRTFLFFVAAGAGGAAWFDRSVHIGGPPDHGVWSRIEGWMEREAPAAREALRTGLNDRSINAAEEVLGLDLPEPYRRSLARHDGQETRGPALVDSGYLLPLQQVVWETRSLGTWHEQTRNAAEAPGWWRPGLIPFVSRDGDYLCLDLKPRPGRRPGEVWALLHDDDPPRSRVAPDFDAWLERWADELDAGVHHPEGAAGADLVPRSEGRQSRLWSE